MTKAEIDKYEYVLLLLGTESCSVCTALDPRIKQWVENELPELPYFKINIKQSPILRGELMVFSVPVILLFKNGKEMMRKAGVFSLSRTFEEIRRIVVD